MTETRHPTRREEMLADIKRVTRFIIGWHPGYEDAIQWGSDGPTGPGENNVVFQAAKRLRDAADLLREEGEPLTFVRAVYDRFVTDEAQGYRSRDRQFAIELLGKALGEARVDPVPPPPHQDEQKG